MNQTGMHEQILEAYLTDSRHSLNDIARRNGVALGECESEWGRLSAIGTVFRAAQASGHEPSQMAINRILAHAREAAAHDLARASRFSFLNGFFRPSFAMAAVVTGLTFGLFAWKTTHLLPTQPLATVAQAPDAMQSLQERILTTPLDLRQEAAPRADFTRRYQFQSPTSIASPVSAGEIDTRLQADIDLDQKVLAGDLLNDKDLEVLFYRARKFERQGLFRDALRDYQFLAKVYPDYEQGKAIQLAIANCLEGLKQKGKAIQVLENLENTYGESEDIELRLDALKSVTF